ncbi:MAG: ankyrin repeat domain-containing protein [Planctomycetota bacterium]
MSSDPKQVYLEALGLIAGGDASGLEALLRREPAAVHTRIDWVGPPYDAYFRQATLLHHVSGNPLVLPVPGNAPELAGVMLRAGAAVDAETDFGEWSWTTLGLVTSSSGALAAGVSEALIDTLLAAGANINHRNGQPLYAAVFHICEDAGLVDVARMLLQRGATPDLAALVSVGDLDRAATLVSDDGTLQPGAYGLYRHPKDRILEPATDTAAVLAEALVFAAAAGQCDAIDWLVARGANPSGTARCGGNPLTPLHLAARVGSLPAVERLLAHGADRTITEPAFNATPRGWAEHFGFSDLVARLEQD